MSVKAGPCLPGFRLFQPASRKLSAASLELWVGNQRQFAQCASIANAFIRVICGSMPPGVSAPQHRGEKVRDGF